MASTICNLRELKNIDVKTKCLVYGYNHRILKTLRSQPLFQNISSLIHSLCILYFFENEHFEIAGKGIRISEDRMSITNHEGSDYQNCSYLSNKLPSTDDIHCKWSFKVHASSDDTQSDQSSYISIGITSNDEYDCDFTTWRGRKEQKKCEGYAHYAYNGYMGYKSSSEGVHGGTKYGRSYSGGDTVDVEVDLKNQWIAFSKNGRSQGIAFKVIQRNEDITYRLGVSLGRRGIAVTLSSFERIFN